MLMHHNKLQEIFADVSRETLGKLELYLNLLLKWNKRMNLISKSTEKDAWLRHIIDSLQIKSFIKKSDIVLDIGTGAGFPGMVISIAQGNKVFLVEKDKKKAIFLHAVKIATNANIEIKNSRIEETKISNVDIITCRAFASLNTILCLTNKYNARLILFKGANYKKEIQEAEDNGWKFNLKIFLSSTDNNAVLLMIDNIKKNG